MSVTSAPIAIRADASPSLGGGHVMRCLTLARELSDRGAAVAFFSAPGTVAAVPALAASGFAVVEVGPAIAELRSAIAAWQPAGVDWLIIDTYAMGVDDEAPLRAVARRILIIDDLANRPHDCDLLLDQNLGRSPGDYKGLVPASGMVLAGPRYAILRPEFAALRAITLARREGDRACDRPASRILVTLGLTDVGGISEPVARALLDATEGLSHPPAIDVVVGARAPSLPALTGLASRHARLALHVETAKMATLMASADLCVGAAGSTSWERCCLGLPTVLLVLADNQRAGASALATSGAAEMADGPADAARLAAALSTDPPRLAAMIASASVIADGYGTGRIVRRMLGQADDEPEVTVRRASPADAALFWAWRNEPAVRAVSRTSAAIPWPSHQDWFARAIGAPDRHLLVCETIDGPAALVRFDPRRDDPGSLLTSIVVAADLRGKGLGSKCLIAALDHLARSGAANQKYAEISTGNSASERIFAAAGYRVVGEADGAGFRTWLRRG